MARIRSVKPEMRRSLTVSSWPYPVRWTFVGLPGYVDDEGRGIDDCRLVKAELYPLDDDMTAKKLDRHLTQIAENGPLCRYEVEGKRYLHLVSWAEHQRVNRPSPSVIPPCPIHEKDGRPHGAVSERSLNDHGGVSDASLPSRAPAEQGREQGTGSMERGSESGSTVPAEAVRAYVLACPEPPAKALQARIEKQARALIAEGHAPARIVAAAGSAGRGGWTDLATQMQRDAARASPQHGTSTTDQRTRSALDLADRLENNNRRAIE